MLVLKLEEESELTNLSDQMLLFIILSVRDGSDYKECESKNSKNIHFKIGNQKKDYSQKLIRPFSVGSIFLMI